MVHEARVPVARIDRCMFRLDATVAVTMRAMASFSRWRNERCPGLQKYGPPHVSYEAKCQFVITALLGVQAPPTHTRCTMPWWPWWPCHHFFLPTWPWPKKQAFVSDLCGTTDATSRVVKTCACFHGKGTKKQVADIIHLLLYPKPQKHAAVFDVLEENTST